MQGLSGGAQSQTLGLALQKGGLDLADGGGGGDGIAVAVLAQGVVRAAVADGEGQTFGKGMHRQQADGQQQRHQQASQPLPCRNLLHIYFLLKKGLMRILSHSNFNCFSPACQGQMSP